MSTKVCTTCQREARLEEFPTKRCNKDGHAARCKKCVSKSSKASYLAKKNRHDKVAEKECSSCRIVKSADEFYAHPLNHDGLFTTCRVCTSSTQNHKNKTVYKARVTEYSREYVSSRRSKLGGFSRAGYPDILRRDGNRCYLCLLPTGPSRPISFDHIIPISKGGPHAANNIAVACGPCNSRKHAKLPDQLPLDLQLRVYSKIAELRGLPTGG